MPKAMREDGYCPVPDCLNAAAGIVMPLCLDHWALLRSEHRDKIVRHYQAIDDAIDEGLDYIERVQKRKRRQNS